MTEENPKDELMIRVATAIYTVAVGAGSEGYKVEDFYPEAILAIDAVRAYDAERRASVLDVDALKTFDPKSPGTLVWLPDGMPSIPTHDPDDYRDLPVAMTVPVRFRGGLTEGKP